LIKQQPKSLREKKMVDTLLMALALALIIEGLIPALFPNKWRNYVLKLAEESTSSIRNIGVSLIIFGAFILWLLQ
jgi:uncharacterized protein YjeT (DUF2065 family)